MMRMVVVVRMMVMWIAVVATVVRWEYLRVERSSGGGSSGSGSG